MGTLFDLFKEIPLSGVLKEKLAELEAKYGAAETENAILKDDLRKAKAHIVELEQEIKRLTHTEDLDETSVKILAHLADDGGLVEASDLKRLLKLHEARVKHLMDNLERQGYVEGKHYAGGEVSLYSLTPKGREYAVKNGLI